MRIAREVSTQSHCLSRKIGSVLVRDNHLLSTGYSGPPKNIPHCEYRDDKGNYTSSIVDIKCPRQRMGFRSGEGLDNCPSVHGEANSIVQAARFGVSVEGAILYCFCNIPCIACSKEIINAGIKRVVCLCLEEYQKGIKSAELFNFAGVQLDVVEERER